MQQNIERKTRDMDKIVLDKPITGRRAKMQQILENYLNRSFYLYRKKMQHLNILLLALILFSVTTTFLAITLQFSTIFRAIQLVGLLALLTSVFFVLETKIDSSYLKFVFISYLVWQFFIVVRGDYSFNKDFLLSKVISPYGVLMYCTPVFLLFPRNLFFYKRLFDVIYILTIIYLLSLVLFKSQIFSEEDRDTIEYLTKYIEIGAGFILLTFPFNSPRKQILAIIVIILTMLIVAYKGRRSNLFMQSEYIMCSFFLYMLFNKKKSKKTYLYTVLILILFSGFYFLYQNQKKGTFKTLTERMYDDTRSGVEKLWVKDFLGKPLDLFIGRGVDGTYTYDQYDLDEHHITKNRSWIETGYMDIIMKGGIISIFFILLIALPAIYIGIFKTRNMFTKGAALMILIWLINLYPDSLGLYFIINHMIVWICVGICYSKNIRELPDNRLKCILK